MSKLLINGCSYANMWGRVSKEFGTKLGFDETVNLGLNGGSNARSFRTTQNYILENKVDFVIVMLTHWARTESPWMTYAPIEGKWISYCDPGTFVDPDAPGSRQFLIPKENARDFAKARILNECYPGDQDKLLTELLFFTGWLKSIGMPYLIFGACNMEYNDPRAGIPKAKIDAVNADKRIIDIFNWSSNKFLHESGKAGCEEKIHPYTRHYFDKEHYPLNNFLSKYITDNKLL